MKYLQLLKDNFDYDPLLCYAEVSRLLERADAQKKNVFCVTNRRMLH